MRDAAGNDVGVGREPEGCSKDTNEVRHADVQLDSYLGQGQWSDGPLIEQLSREICGLGLVTSRFVRSSAEPSGEPEGEVMEGFFGRELATDLEEQVVEVVDGREQPSIGPHRSINSMADQIGIEHLSVKVRDTLTEAASCRSAAVVHDTRRQQRDCAGRCLVCAPVEVKTNPTVINHEKRPAVVHMGWVSMLDELSVKHLANPGHRWPPGTNHLRHIKIVQDGPRILQW